MPNAQDRVRIGVRLAPPSEISAWLTEGAAFDAAGVDALWLDLRAEPRFDPYLLTASLAAVTYRSLLVLEVPADDGSPSARSAETLVAISRGRLVLATDEAPDDAVDAATFSAVLQRIPSEPGSFEQRAGAGEPARRWEAVEVPASRAAWREALAGAAGRGVHGLVVAADPRLLDLLRNPDDDIDRRDLQLAAG